MRLRVLALAAFAALALAGPAAAERYVVLYKDHGWSVWGAKGDVKKAGGSLVASYPEIDVVVAESSDPGFPARMDRIRGVEGVAASGSAVASAAGHSWGGDGGSGHPVSDDDTFSPLQWWSQRINAPDAHAITGGSRKVVVGVIDTGVDPTHPDLDDNIDWSRSASCVSGAAVRDPAAWNDDSGHGTNVAGVIAAEANGIGIVGIAPNVRLAVIKASVHSGDSDFFLPDAVICSLMWAADHDVDVANNSYSTDSALSGGTTAFCKDDEEQRIIIKAVGRAVEFAQRRGVSVVASAGNDGIDVNDPANAGCKRLPSQLSGVIAVSSIGLNDQLAAGPPSNFGLGFVDVTAPGGDFLQGVPPAGLVLGPWPAAFQVPRLLCDPCTGPNPGYYRYFAGTSQAAAQVSGVAALVVGELADERRHRGWWSWWKKVDPDRVASIVKRTAEPLPCPDGDARCVTLGKSTSFYGRGLVDALAAVEAADRD
jgi:subtilisin family serine protease